MFYFFSLLSGSDRFNKHYNPWSLLCLKNPHPYGIVPKCFVSIPHVVYGKVSSS